MRRKYTAGPVREKRKEGKKTIIAQEEKRRGSRRQRMSEMSTRGRLVKRCMLESRWHGK